MCAHVSVLLSEGIDVDVQVLDGLCLLTVTPPYKLYASHTHMCTCVACTKILSQIGKQSPSHARWQEVEQKRSNVQ
jgi:hypothetical protein